MNAQLTECPHCQNELKEWDPSPYTAWGDHMLYCDNNDCTYFIRGREKIFHEHDKNFGYRYCYDPIRRKALPLIAWCPGELSLKRAKCVAT